MKTEDITRFGDIANLLRILSETDKMMELLADPRTLQTMGVKEIDNAFDGLLRTRLGVANMLASLGDYTGYKTDPPKSRNKRP